MRIRDPGWKNSDQGWEKDGFGIKTVIMVSCIRSVFLSIKCTF
jgi:hypothetical protein